MSLSWQENKVEGRPFLHLEVNDETGDIERAVCDPKLNHSNYIAGPLELPLVGIEGPHRVEGYSALLVGYASAGESESAAGSWVRFRPSDTADRFVWQDDHLEIVKTFRREAHSTIIEWAITSRQGEVTIDELALSLPVNNDYTPWMLNQRFLYDHKVYEHNYPGGTNGYQLVEKLNGNSPLLYCVPQAETRFEHVSHYPGTIGQVRPGIQNHSWPGSSLMFLHAKGYLERNGYKPLFSGQETTSLTLGAGQTVVYAVKLGFIPEREDLGRMLAGIGKLHATVSPAFTGAVGDEIELSAFGPGRLSVAEHEALEPAGRRELAEGGTAWTFKLRKPGMHTIDVCNESSTMKVVVRATSRVPELFDKRADFILNHQVFRQEGHALDEAIVPYTIDGFEEMEGEGLYAKEESIWGNGSYEGGITEAMFAAEKNVKYPNPKQVKQLERYIDLYVRRYLQNPDTNEVVWWCYGFSNTRSYNYMHVANLYFSMYRIALHHELTEKKATDYLFLTYSTLIKMYEISRPVDLVAGFMGGQRVFEILKELERSNWIEYYFILLLKVREQSRLYFEGDVPYGSECAYDNTGYECIAYYADYFRQTKCIDELYRVMLAARGAQPVWWWHGSDIRWWDPTTDFAEGCHHYTSPLNSSALLMLVRKGHLKPTPEMLSLIYSGILGATGKIHPDGRASMSYCWEQESPNFGDHVCTGDSGLSLFGTLIALRSFAYLPAAGMPVGYLCGVSGGERAEQWSFAPSELSGDRFSWYREETGETGDLDLNAGQIEEAVIGLADGSIRARIRPFAALKCAMEICFRLSGRIKSMSIDGTVVRFTPLAEEEYKLIVPATVGADSFVLEIDRETER